MPTSPTTSDSSREQFRAAVLDVLFAQWRDLGVPVHAPVFAAPLEVIDPEELLWCSLEFVESEPRLLEAVNGWFAGHGGKVNRQRINKLARAVRGDSRSALWRALDEQSALRASGTRPEVSARHREGAGKPLGERSPNASTLYLRARDLLGNDCRSLLIVQLVAGQRGVRLRDVASATGYTYRNLAEAATSWQRARVVTLDHGYCTLSNPTLWNELLGIGKGQAVTIDWHAAFSASIELLHTLGNARELQRAPDHARIRAAQRAAQRAARAAIEQAAGGVDFAKAPALSHLRAAVVGGE